MYPYFAPAIVVVGARVSLLNERPAENDFVYNVATATYGEDTDSLFSPSPREPGDIAFENVPRNGRRRIYRLRDRFRID